MFTLYLRSWYLLTTQVSSRIELIQPSSPLRRRTSPLKEAKTKGNATPGTSWAKLSPTTEPSARGLLQSIHESYIRTVFNIVAVEERDVRLDYNGGKIEQRAWLR
jgi:hypothetical protein